MKEKVMNGLEKFSKAMLSPLSYISAAGLILVLGALLTSTSLSAMIPVLQWTPIKLLGQLIYNCIMVIINNLSLMFCVGIAAALAKKNKQQAAIIGLMSYFMYLTAGNVTLTQLGMLAEADPLVGLYGTGQSTVFGIQTVDMGVFGGILLGLVCGWVYNRTCEKQFKGIITQIYSGNRWSFTCMVVFSILFGFGSCFFWPPVQNVISALTDLIATSGNFGLFLYGFLERFLIPTGLHHLIYTPFQFSALGNSLTVGDATYTGSYIVMMMEYSMGLPFSDGIVWMYTGFTKTFGYFGIVAAFIFCARKENRKKTAAKYLEQNGYTIRDRNWRKNHLELDIVADKDKELIIVEVKTRSNTDYIEPQDAVNWQKIRRIVVAADAYIKHFCLDAPVRFDIITAVGEPGAFKIEHLKEAFYPPMF